MEVVKMLNEKLKEISSWSCPIHNKKLIKLPLPDDYKGPKAHLEVYFCEDCKRGYSILDLLEMSIKK